MLGEFDVSLPRSRPTTVRTDEDTIAFVRRLAQYHDDATIAGILDRQERTTARGLRVTQNLVGNLRRSWDIPRCTGSTDSFGRIGEWNKTGAGAAKRRALIDMPGTRLLLC
jgi:hypothetical protein